MSVLKNIMFGTIVIGMLLVFHNPVSVMAQVDTKTHAKGFKVEVNGNFTPCVSYSGGDLTGEKAEASSGSSQTNESTMGLNTITELTLVSFVTPDDNTISDAAALLSTYPGGRYTITITEMAKDKSTVRTFVYGNCLLTSMDFPSVDAAGGEMLKRTSTWKPEILTVSLSSGNTISSFENPRKV